MQRLDSRPQHTLAHGVQQHSIVSTLAAVARTQACDWVSVYDSPTSCTVPPRRRTASTLICGVVTGMQIRASHPCSGQHTLQTRQEFTVDQRQTGESERGFQRMLRMWGRYGQGRAAWSSGAQRRLLTRWLAAKATPCAWLPADEVMTPRASSSGVSCAILLKAPRSLKENTCTSVRNVVPGPAVG